MTSHSDISSLFREPRTKPITLSEGAKKPCPYCGLAYWIIDPDGTPKQMPHTLFCPTRNT